MPSLNVFVYGTLKQGCRNHARYAAGAAEILPARVWGRLYALRGLDYPGLELPPALLLATGTNDPLADAALAADYAARGVSFDPQGPQGFGAVHGECLRFDDPAKALPALDALEGFVPQGAVGGASSDEPPYSRSLIAAQTDLGAEPLWVYHMAAPIDGVLIPKGVWYPPLP